MVAHEGTAERGRAASPAIDPSRTALVLVDLQNGLIELPLAPLSGAEVVAVATRLSAHFRTLGSPVVTVAVAFPTGDEPPIDIPLPAAPETMPPGWDEIVDGLAEPATDIRVTKSGWGAFASTDLSAILRGRGVDTIVLAGIATNFGVEQTAREGVANGFAVLAASDAMSSLSTEHHEFSVTKILPRLGRVRTVGELIEASSGAA